MPDIEQTLLAWVYQDILEQFGVNVAIGDGTNKASGLFGGTSYYQTVLSGSAGAVTNTSILSLFGALQPVYLPNAVWLVSLKTLSVLLGLARPNLNNTPLVEQGADSTYTMLGRPVLVCSSAPEIGAAAYPSRSAT